MKKINVKLTKEELELVVAIIQRYDDTEGLLLDGEILLEKLTEVLTNSK